MANIFPFINPLLHSELRLKMMVALDSLESAEFMYLCRITECTRGNLSVQIKILSEAGYLEVTKIGFGHLSRTVCRITPKGHEALHAYEEGLRQLFSQEIPTQEDYNTNQNNLLCK
jgi:DNA-binding MarR family transcriptional regulator